MSYRNRPLLDLAYGYGCMLRLPCCTGGDCGEPAHSNQGIHGKAGAMKAHDCFHVPACRECHAELDQGMTMTRDEKNAAWARAFGEYLARLFADGRVAVTPKTWRV